MIVRAAFLSIPALDADASAAVREVLRAALGSVVVLHDGYAAESRHWVEETLRRWCDEEEIDLIVTIGGTMPAPGHTADERVPEATEAVIERKLPGLAETMRAYAQEESSLALLDRGTAGIRGRTLILNLPAGARAAALFLEAVADLIAPTLAFLRDGDDVPSLEDALATSEDGVGIDDETPPSAPAPSKGLDADEFAEFLRRRRGARGDAGEAGGS